MLDFLFIVILQSIWICFHFLFFVWCDGFSLSLCWHAHCTLVTLVEYPAGYFIYGLGSPNLVSFSYCFVLSEFIHAHSIHWTELVVRYDFPFSNFSTVFTFTIAFDKLERHFSPCVPLSLACWLCFFVLDCCAYNSCGWILLVCCILVLHINFKMPIQFPILFHDFRPFLSLFLTVFLHTCTHGCVSC